MSFVLTVFILNTTGATDWAAIILGIVTFFLSYGILVPIVGGLSKTDLRDLDGIIDASNPVGIPVKILLSLLVKITK